MKAPIPVLAVLLLAAAGTLTSAAPAAAQVAKSYQFGEKRFRKACPRPLKYAAGACVRRCPAGYADHGGFCRLRSQHF